MNKLKKNEVYKVTILDVTHEGAGIAKIEGFPVFVNNALKDEVMDIHLIKVTSKYAIAKPIKIEKSSKDRVDPFCEVYKRCGGCDLQHMNYEAQLILKKQIVENNLRRIGGFKEIKVNEIIKMDNPFAYRNKVQYPVENNRAGFYAKNSHDIIEHDECLVQDEKVNEIMNYLKDKLDHNIRHVVFRIADEGIMLIFVSRTRTMGMDIESITKKFSIIKTVIMNYNISEGNVVMGYENTTLFGKGTIEDSLLDLTFRISPNSFYQVNKIQTEKLYSKVIEFAGENKNQTIFDLYCGIGTISLCVAKHFKNVFGIETVEAAVNDANINKEMNHIENVTFICNRAEDEIENLYMNNIKADVVIVDPPRKGCDQKLLDTINKMKAEKVIYVSCDSATLARDLKILCESDYIIKEIVAVDMFPHTKHVETVVLMSRKDK
ncbi:MAG: 23S rRNA (uracil(1939)-C(5))-methyltransferase RlmD [Clostridia bacterium]|nr:23S rRNA (uracil(1939)-C(5))-methyltransferase RlmD [Clostridia bacterium]